MNYNFDLIIANDSKKELSRVLECNDYSKTFGLSLTEADTKQLMECRINNLKENERIEFGNGILPELIWAFCDSPYIYQDNYSNTLMRLQEIFYEYKNESVDEISDNELICYMKRHFDGDCQGSLDYLEETCLEKLARMARSDFDNFIRRHGVDDI